MTRLKRDDTIMSQCNPHQQNQRSRLPKKEVTISKCLNLGDYMLQGVRNMVLQDVRNTVLHDVRNTMLHDVRNISLAC